MSRESATVSKEVHDVIAAKWDGFRTLAKALPHRHILAVELVRTLHDETIAVFTIARHGEPVRYVVTGDAHGRLKAIEYDPRAADHPQAAVAALPQDGGAADPASFALGEPPVKQPGTPGVVAIGGALLADAFGVGELVDTSPK